MSGPLQEAHPDLHRNLREIVKCCRSFDRDLRTRNLLVDVRRLRDNCYCGSALPKEYSWDRRRRHGSQLSYHQNGKITMSINERTPIEGIARLFSHELRHIAQFHRGKRQFGTLTILSLTPLQAEDDAYEFEDDILGRLGL